MRETSLPGCLIVTGCPGAGKTTVTRRVAAALPRSARLDGDDVYQMTVNGRVGPVSEPREEARRQLLLRARNLCSLAVNFAEAGFTPVVDHVVPDREVLGFMIERLRPLPVLFVVLAPPLEVCYARNQGRDPRERVPYAYDGLYRSMREQLGGTGWWLDTGRMGAEETAAAVLAEAPAKALVTPTNQGSDVAPR